MKPLSRAKFAGWASFGLVLTAGLVGAQPPEPPMEEPVQPSRRAGVALAEPQAPEPAKESAPASAQPRFEFEMRDKPWDQVLEWLSDASGLPVAGGYKPDGTFNFIGTAKKKHYTVAEVIDILNETLLSKKYILIRRPTSIIIVPSEKPDEIDSSLIPRVAVEDLEVDKLAPEQKLGRTELVQIVFTLNSLTAEDAEKDLKSVLGPFKRIQPISRGNKLLVTDTAGNLRRAVKMMEEIDGSGRITEFNAIPLGIQDGEIILKILQANYGIKDGSKPVNAPFLEWDKTRNAVIVRGTPQQVQEVRDMIRKLGGGGGVEGGGTGERTRIISVDGRSPEAVLEAVVSLWADLRANPIETVSQSQFLPRLESMKKGQGAPKRIQLPGQLRDPRETTVRKDLPGDKDKPVLLTALLKPAGSDTPVRSSIMVGSDDPEALVLVNDLVSYLTQPGDGDFVVMPLQYANAIEVAKVIDDIFNGPRQQSARGMNPMMMMMMGGGGRGGSDRERDETPAAIKTSRPVRVVADPRTNSLLVKAPQLELFKIRKMLETHLDVEGVDTAALAKTFFIGPLKNANVADVANVIEEVYAEFITKNDRQRGGMMPFGFPGMRGMPQENTPKAVTLAVSLDERTNTLIVSCPEPLYLQIKGVVEELDKTASESNRVVKVVRVNNIDPELVQRAVQAMTGETSQQRRGQQPSSDQQMRDGIRGMFMQRLLGGGSGNTGGRGTRGGGSGGRGGRGGGGGIRPADVRPDAALGGPDFFESRVMDDPRMNETALYDPQLEDELLEKYKLLAMAQPEGQQAEEKPKQQPPAKPGEPAKPVEEDVRAPRRPVSVEALPDVGQVIITGDPADVDEVIKIIEQLQKIAAPAEMDIRVFKLKQSDSVSVANTLTQLYQRLIVGAGSTTRLPATQQAQESSVIVLALPRQNAVLVGAPKGRMKDIEDAINKLDLPLTPGVQFKPYPLKRAKAEPVAETIRQFYTQRYAGEGANQNQVRIQADEGTNTVLIQASPADQEEIERLIKYLESNLVPAEVKVFPLKRADAMAMQFILQQLFTGAQAGGGRQGQQGGQFPGQQGGDFGGQFQQMAQMQQAGGRGQQAGRGQQQQTDALVELAMAVDQRTNSLIIAGTRNDLQLVETIVFRLDSQDIRERINKVYKLKNTQAIDVYNAVNGLFRREIDLLSQQGEISPFQQIEREVVIVPEEVNNALIISATPRAYKEVIRLVEEIDEEPPQVVIQVMIAEVRMDNTEEFGVEIGVQSPVLFQRGIIPADGFLGTGTIGYTAPATGVGLVPPGVTVNSSINPAAVPGFNWNNLGQLPNNPVVHPSSSAPQGISNFGLGRASSTAGVGGFVFSAASDSFNLLIRALKTQGKIDVLSRPQIMTLDNQPAFIQVGQSVPIIATSNINQFGNIVNTVNYRDIGIILEVTPKVSPDGHVIMRIDPEVSTLAPTTVNLGNNVFAPAFNTTTASTTVSAMDGQTVAIGGLITRRDDKLERKIPWFGDLPVVGAAFRYRTQNKQKTELLIVLTPRIVRSQYDAEIIKAEEARKMDWVLRDVEAIHGPLGINDFYAPAHDGACEQSDAFTLPIQKPLFPVEELPPTEPRDDVAPSAPKPPVRPMPAPVKPTPKPAAVETPPPPIAAEQVRKARPTPSDAPSAEQVRKPAPEEIDYSRYDTYNETPTLLPDSISPVMPPPQKRPQTPKPTSSAKPVKRGYEEQPPAFKPAKPTPGASVDSAKATPPKPTARSQAFATLRKTLPAMKSNEPAGEEAKPKAAPQPKPTVTTAAASAKTSAKPVSAAFRPTATAEKAHEPPPAGELKTKSPQTNLAAESKAPQAKSSTRNSSFSLLRKTLPAAKAGESEKEEAKPKQSPQASATKSAPRTSQFGKPKKKQTEPPSKADTKNLPPTQLKAAAPVEAESPASGVSFQPSAGDPDFEPVTDEDASPVAISDMEETEAEVLLPPETKPAMPVAQRLQAAPPRQVSTESFERSEYVPPSPPKQAMGPATKQQPSAWQPVIQRTAPPAAPEIKRTAKESWTWPFENEKKTGVSISQGK